MGKLGVIILGAFVGGLAATLAVVFWLGWGDSRQGQPAHADPSRGDYVDLLLTLVTVLMGAIGLAVTVGAVVIGLVALKTLREIKDDAASAAQVAAADKISKAMDELLEPNVKAKVKEAMPAALNAALLEDELGYQILDEMARKGELDKLFDRVAMRTQGAGPEFDPEYAEQYADDDIDHAK